MARSPAPRVGRRLALLAALLGPGLAAAGTVIPNGTTGLDYVTGGVRFVDGPGAGTFVGRTFDQPSIAQRTIGLSEKVGLQLQGRSLVATVGRTVAMGEVALAAAALGGSLYVGYQIGTGIAKTLGLGAASNGTRIVPTSDGWKFDEGLPPQDSAVFSALSSNFVAGLPADQRFTSATVGGVCALGGQALVAQRNQIDGPTWEYVFTGVTTNGLQCTANYTERFSNGGTPQPRSTTVTTQETTTKKCPAYVDPLDPALSRPDGDAAGPDGKCAAGRYTTVAPPIVAERIATYGDPSTLKDFAQDVLSKGGTITTQSPRTVVEVNPPSVIEQPVTTTSTAPDGTTTTTTKTPTTTYVKTGDTITYNQTFNSVTQTCTGQGSCTTSSTSTTTPSTTTTTDPDAPKTDCDKIPDSIGCMKLGEAPNDQVPKKTSPITFTPEQIGGGGACPAPIPIYRGEVFSYQPLCDNLVRFKPLIIALGFVAAGMIVANALRA